jgi:flagellar biosynthesis/type III secretory pathway protein FliH
MISPSDQERERQEARLKFQRDWSSSMAAARKEGFEQGFQQGLERARKVAVLIGQIHA